jgi:hypothetical protein
MPSFSVPTGSLTRFLSRRLFLDVYLITQDNIVLAISSAFFRRYSITTKDCRLALHIIACTILVRREVSEITGLNSLARILHRLCEIAALPGLR